MPHTSVVMVTYHTGCALWSAVDSVLSEPEVQEFIIVNNGNPDEVNARLEWFAKKFPVIRLISAQGNVGFARGCNLGASLATGNYLLLLNPDCILPPDALNTLRHALDTTPQAMVASGTLVHADGSPQQGGRRNLLTPKNAFMEGFGLRRFCKPDNTASYLHTHQEPLPSSIHEVPAASGAFMFMRRKDYQKLGGLDEQYFLHVEDMDFFMRVHKADGKTIIVPQLKIIHSGATSDSPQIVVEWHKARGFHRYFYKFFKSALFPPLWWGLVLSIYARFALRALRSMYRWIKPRLWLADVEKRERAMHRLRYYHHTQPELLTLSEKRFLVTGATSQVGVCTIGRLLKENATAIALTRHSPLPYTHPKLIWQQCDFTTDEFAPMNTPETLLHLAPIWLLPDRIAYCLKIGIKRIIAVSSSSVQGKADSLNAEEQAVVEKLKEAENKLLLLCKQCDIHCTILRPTMIYGVGMDSNISTLARYIKHRRFCVINPPAKGSRQPVHADDLAKAVLQVLDKKATYGNTYTVAGNQILSYRDMLVKLFAVLRVRPMIIPVPFLPYILDKLSGFSKGRINGEMARRMNKNLMFDNTPARMDFGYSPRDFLSGGMGDL